MTQNIELNKYYASQVLPQTFRACVLCGCYVETPFMYYGETRAKADLIPVFICWTCDQEGQKVLYETTYDL